MPHRRIVRLSTSFCPMNGPTSGDTRAAGSTPRLSEDALDLDAESIAARFTWARRRGHPEYLWPDLPHERWRRALEEIERATRKVFREEPSSIRWELPPDLDPKAVGVAAFTSGMGPLLGYWVETGTIRARPDVAAVLLLHLQHGRRRAKALNAELIRTASVLHRARITCTVLKGMHTGPSYFPDPGTRPCADIDLLIQPAEMVPATRALRTGGYVPAIHQSRPVKCDWVPPGAPTRLRSLELTHARNPWTIEIHESLDRDFFGIRTVGFGSVGTADTHASNKSVPALRALAQPLLLAFLALHASQELHHLQMVRLVELVLVIRRDEAAGFFSWNELEDMLVRTSAMRFVYPAFELAERLVPGTLDATFRAHLAAAAPALMARVVARLTPANAQRLESLSLDERFMWATGPAEFLRRAAYFIWPRGAGVSRRMFWRRSFERLRRLLHGRVTLRRR